MNSLKINIKMKVYSYLFKITNKKVIEPKYINTNKPMEYLEELLNNTSACNILIITDQNVAMLPIITKVHSVIVKCNKNPFIYTDIDTHPTHRTINLCLKEAHKWKIDYIVAVGGGSVIDVAKIAAASIGNKYIVSSKLEGTMNIKNPAIEVTTIPTTPTIGNGATYISYLNDIITNKSNLIIDNKNVVTNIINDPNLLKTLNDKELINISLYTMTRAFEALISRNANSKTDEWSLTSIKLITDSLEIIINNRANQTEEANEIYYNNLYRAAFYCIKATNHTLIGYATALAREINSISGLSRIEAAVLLLPYMLDDMSIACEHKLVMASNILNLQVHKESKYTESKNLIKQITNLYQRLGIETYLKGMSPSDIDLIITDTFETAHGTYQVPRIYSQDEARYLLYKIVEKESRIIK